MDSSRGVSFHGKGSVSIHSNSTVPRSGSCLLRTGIDPVKIVEIRCEAQSLDGALNVFLDVSGRVGDFALRSEDFEATFRGDYTTL